MSKAWIAAKMFFNFGYCCRLATPVAEIFAEGDRLGFASRCGHGVIWNFPQVGEPTSPGHGAIGEPALE